MVIELIAIKIYEIAESGNTECGDSGTWYAWYGVKQKYNPRRPTIFLTSDILILSVLEDNLT